MPVFALWSAPRARSTAFFRSMLERGDLLALHEPLEGLIYFGDTEVEGRTFRSPASTPGMAAQRAACHQRVPEGDDRASSPCGRPRRPALPRRDPAHVPHPPARGDRGIVLRGGARHRHRFDRAGGTARAAHGRLRRRWTPPGRHRLRRSRGSARGDDGGVLRRGRVAVHPRSAHVGARRTAGVAPVGTLARGRQRQLRLRGARAHVPRRRSRAPTSCRDSRPITCRSTSCSMRSGSTSRRREGRPHSAPPPNR